MSRKPVNKLPLEQRVLSFIQEHRLVKRRQMLLVAVSGGQDSVCLLHVLCNLHSVLGIKLHVAHLDHQLRGKESTGDARYVATLAKTVSTHRGFCPEVPAVPAVPESLAVVQSINRCARLHA